MIVGLGDHLLQEMFRNLHSLAVEPKGWISEVFDKDRNSWSPQFCQNLNDWEVGDLRNLLSLIEGSKA